MSLINSRNVLLMSESWTYLLLAILDLLSHVAPQLRRDVNTFRAVNIVIGVPNNNELCPLTDSIT